MLNFIMKHSKEAKEVKEAINKNARSIDAINTASKSSRRKSDMRQSIILSIIKGDGLKKEFNSLSNQEIEDYSTIAVSIADKITAKLTELEDRDYSATLLNLRTRLLK